MGLPKKVLLRELGPREGFQTVPNIVSTAKKCELIAALNKTGVSVIEVGSYVRPDILPQMADIEDVVAQHEQITGVEYVALYLNRRGFERAEDSGRLNNKGWISIAVSETFLNKNANTTLDNIISEIPKWISSFKSREKNLYGLMVSTAFGCNYIGRLDASKAMSSIRRTVDSIKDAGGDLSEICLADTTGWGNPNSVRELVSIVKEEFPGIEPSLHLHDTRGTGMANIYAGLLEGVKIFDCSVGGLGGCPFAKGAAGNVATEDVAFLCKEMGIETGVDLEKYKIAAQLAESIIGNPLPGKFYKT